MNSRERYKQETRDAVLEVLKAEKIPMSPASLHGNLRCDHWTSIGPVVRSEGEIKAALNLLVKEGLAEKVTERDPEDPPGPLYMAVMTPEEILESWRLLERG